MAGMALARPERAKRARGENIVRIEKRRRLF